MNELQEKDKHLYALSSSWLEKKVSFPNWLQKKDE